ncbi:Mitochondrial matrix iron chaperone [Entomophthora muscae]|uniref:Mitochondrial matrix iron chaperone n=1 Tax=Entomophthora muscae TaxID=34485 RepID=A0ACC2TCZ1_9FUNG|nr:Mitochondrial matrix iron chaperone [Entomophthora muscae]
MSMIKAFKRLGTIRCSLKANSLHTVNASRLLKLKYPKLSSLNISHYSSVTPQKDAKFQISTLDKLQFEKYAEATLSHLVDTLEDLIQDHGDKDFDIEYSSGVMTLCLGDFGTYVINKQPPNSQIWLSSPISGPKRYDFDIASEQWFYYRENTTLFQLLEKELSEAFGVAVKL